MPGPGCGRTRQTDRVPPPRRFREVRYIKNGPAGAAGVVVGILLVGVALIAEPTLVQVALAAFGVAMAAASRLLRVETIVDESTLVIRIPPFRTRTIPFGEIRSTEIVVADNLVPIFGGWNARDSLAGPLVQEVEGDRSVGNKAVRIHLDGGTFVQVGSWKPTQLVEALGNR